MTIKLLEGIQLAGVHQAVGSIITLAPDAEARHVSSNKAVYTVQPDIGDDAVPVTARKTLTGGIEIDGEFVSRGMQGLGFEPMRSVEWIELSAADVVPIASRLNDGRIYGQKGGKIYSSTDGARSWTQVAAATLTGGVEPILILPTDREVIIATNQSVYRSSGWGSAVVSSSLVLTIPAGSTLLEWGIDTSADGQVVVTQYSAADFTKSRHVWYSDDSGMTFRVIRDLNTDSKNDRHIHFAVFDKYAKNRIYISHHNENPVTGSGKSIEYTDDKGATWSEVANITILNEAGDERVVQPTTAVVTPRGLVMGSDDTWTGLYILPRGKSVVEKLAAGVSQPPSNTVTGFATYSQIDQKTGEIYTCWVQSFDENYAYIMASDAVAGSVIYKMPDMYPVSGYGGVGGLPGFVRLTFTDDEIIALARKPSIITPANNAHWILRASRPARSSRVSYTEGDVLYVEAGKKWTRKGPAVCYSAESVGADTLAIGYRAKATHPTSCLVIGNNSAASGNLTTLVGSNITTAAVLDKVIAVGNGAVVGGSFSVRIGSAGDTGGNAVAVGYDAVAYSCAISIGSGTKMAPASAYGVAIGHAVSGNSYAINIGYSSVTTSYGVAVGNASNAGNGVAIGSGSGRNSGVLTGIVAVGRDAICGASDAVAVGKSASSVHANAVAIGASSATQRADSIAVGPRDIESTGSGKGIILRSPIGTAYRISVSDAGVVSATAV